MVEDKRLTRIDVIKIDVEGFEVPVLKGAERSIERLRPTVYGEFKNELMPMGGYSFLDVWALFEFLDYVCHAFGEGGHLTRVVRPEPNRGDAVLAPSERAEELMSEHARALTHPGVR